MKLGQAAGHETRAEILECQRWSMEKFQRMGPVFQAWQCQREIESGGNYFLQGACTDLTTCEVLEHSDAAGNKGLLQQAINIIQRLE
ncbi:MAG: hypothetical protein ACE1Y4_04585 [Lysobacterales bacterium]